MRKILFLLLAFPSILFVGCSSDDNSSDEDSYLNFTLDGFFDFSDTDNYGSYIQRQLNNDNTKTYTINSLMRRNGSNPIFEQDAIFFNVEFTIPDDIFVNQVIQVTSFSYTNEFLLLPHNNNNFNGQTATNFCDQLWLQTNTSTTGTLTITQINDEHVYGTFNFNNLSNSNSGSSCTNYPNQQYYNISQGEFKAVKL